MTGARALKDDPLFGADSRWSWITAFSCCWVLFLALATPRVSGIFFYGIVKTFMVSREDASWAVSLAGALMALAGPIAGDLCERFSCRAVLLTCSSLAGIGAGLCYLAEDLLFIAISFGVVHGIHYEFADGAVEYLFSTTACLLYLFGAFMLLNFIWRTISAMLTDMPHSKR